MNIDVHIQDVSGTQMAAKITGIFRLDDGTRDFEFTAIAFGRIGGQNIGANLSDKTEGDLKGLGYDVDDVVMLLQKSLLQGNLTLPEGLTRESFIDDYDRSGTGGGGADNDGRNHNNNSDGSGDNNSTEPGKTG